MRTRTSGQRRAGVISYDFSAAFAEAGREGTSGVDRPSLYQLATDSELRRANEQRILQMQNEVQAYRSALLDRSQFMDQINREYGHDTGAREHLNMPSAPSRSTVSGPSISDFLLNSTDHISASFGESSWSLAFWNVFVGGFTDASNDALHGDYTLAAFGVTTSLVKPLRALRIGPRWRARDIADAVCEQGCEAVARQIQRHVGGDIVRITPVQITGRETLGGFRGKSWNGSHHEVVIKDGRVFDITTGHQGLPIDEYKKLWQYADGINFGF